MQSNTKDVGLTMPRGFTAAGGACGIKASGAPDLALIVAEGPCTAAGVFTTNRVCGAPVLLNRDHLKKTAGVARAIVCNSGNSNSSTGKPGLRDAQAMAASVAEKIGCKVEQVLVNSTGVIGRPMPMDKVLAGIEKLVPELASGPAADQAAARAIMTTDLVPKTARASLALGTGKRKVTVQLGGICKGSGMIAPNMATMLVFLTTDAAISAPMLRKALLTACQASFNRISVDQHTSPSDTVLVLASGMAGNKAITRAGRELDAFTLALTTLCKDLAYQIVKDGEGATKVFRVRVVGASSEKVADQVARAIVDSPLVKTAVHGGDPNWGRITTAAGYSGAKLDPATMSLFVGPKKDICVFRQGQPTPQGSQPPASLKAMMQEKDITFTLVIGKGKASVEWLGCDLSREYIAINADYTT